MLKLLHLTLKYLKLTIPEWTVFVHLNTFDKKQKTTTSGPTPTSAVYKIWIKKEEKTPTHRNEIDKNEIKSRTTTITAIAITIITYVCKNMYLHDFGFM